MPDENRAFLYPCFSNVFFWQNQKNANLNSQPSDSETTKEHRDADPKGEMQSSNKYGGVAFLGSPRAKKYAGISVGNTSAKR